MAAARSGMSAGGITKTISEYSSSQTIGDKTLVLLDSPGVGDEDVTPMKLLSMIEQYLGGNTVDGILVTSPATECRVKLGGTIVKTLVDKGFVGQEKWQNVI